MSIGHADDFARILSLNQVIRCLFSQYYIFCQKDDPFHLNFIVPLSDEQSTAVDKSVEILTEYKSYHNIDADTDIDESLQWDYFALSLEDSCLSEYPHLGWRFGRDINKQPNCDIDILLAKSKDLLSKSLANNHFSLRISNQSGLLMFFCGKAKHLDLEIHINDN